MASRALRSKLPAVVAGSLVLLGATAQAQERTPLPGYTGVRVIALGVPDTFQDLKAQITRLEKSSPQSYYVVVVKSAGSGRVRRGALC